MKLPRKVLCADWDKRSLRLVMARTTGGKMVLEDAHSHRLPVSLDADDPAAMGEFIKQMLERHRLRSRVVLVDVPRERAVMNRLTFAPTPENEVAAAVRFQAMRELPFPLESAAADYVITKRDEQGLVVEALLAAVTLETMNRIKETCAAAGLTPARIGLRPYANLISVRHVARFQEKRVLFIDVGPGATEIDVFAEDALAFARSANVNVPVPVPKTEPGAHEDSRIISLADIADYASEEAIAAAVDELLVEVTRTLQAYRATDTEAVIDGVMVAGGTGIETQFAEVLHRRLGYPVELYDPTGPLSVDVEQAAKLRSFSAALGLAWGGAREGLLALDFLNPKRPISNREILQRRVRMGLIGAAAVLALAAAGYGRYYLTQRAELERLQKANRALRAQVEEKRKIQDLIDQANAWAQEAVWPEELLRIAQSAIEPGKKMLVGGIEMRSDTEQQILLRNLHVTDDQLPYDFVKELNALSADGKPVYKADARGYTQLGQAFKGKLDIMIDLLRLQEAQEKAKPARR